MRVLYHHRTQAEDGQAVEYGQALAGIDALELELAPEDGEDMG